MNNCTQLLHTPFSASGHHHCPSSSSSPFNNVPSPKDLLASSTRALHGSSALYTSPTTFTNSYHHHHHHQQHHGREDSLSPTSISIGGGGSTLEASLPTSPSLSFPTSSDNKVSRSLCEQQQHSNVDEENASSIAAAEEDQEEFANYRRILIENPTSSLGISLVGGNAIGIFVHQIRDEQLLSSGLAPGDQIIEYNGTDLRHSTAEEAAIELAKPADTIKLVVYYNPKRYQQIQETTIGDSFYIKVSFDRPSIDGSLAFAKNNVLYVDNTMYQGVPGVWGAWSVNAFGEKDKFGVIPSKYKAEEELMMKRCYDNSSASHNNGASGSGTLGSSTRRSFFRRRKNGSGSGR